MDIVDAAVSGDIVLLLAAMVVILGGVISVLAVVVYREMRGRIERSEGLTDAMVAAFDDLGPATQKAADVAQAALDELRRGR